jgi:hypothetical protein
MIRTIINLGVGAIGGTVFGFALGIFIYPFWLMQEPAMERLAASADRTEIAAGTFTHVNRLDPIHWGKGAVSVFREAEKNATVYLHDDFAVGPGPRFHVYLVDRPNIQSGDDFLASKRVDLGRLRAFAGSQVYPVPAGMALSGYRSIVIWCKEFGVLISPASLRAAS